MRTAVMQGFLGRQWNFMSSFGLWIYNPRFGGYCFLPFGSGWNSRYGFGYGSGMDGGSIWIIRGGICLTRIPAVQTTRRWRLTYASGLFADLEHPVTVR